MLMKASWPVDDFENVTACLWKVKPQCLCGFRKLTPWAKTRLLGLRLAVRILTLFH